MTEIDIARACHEANKVYCESIGDKSQKHWEQSEHWQRLGCIAGVRFRILNPKASVSSQHSAWVAEKVADGWSYGPVKNPEKKTHPCICPYEELPAHQKIKDVLFISIVNVLKICLKKESE